MLVSQQSVSPHERIGRYEVLRKIATGGMAELFLAKQVGMEGFEKVVAIKRILAHLAFDEEFINMFRDEARIVAKLSHPNIVQIYDLGKSDDTYFIAMEYIPGRNLSSVAKKAKAKGVPLPPEYIARCIAQACEGLYYAHTRQDIDGRPLKIVHRDVSPQNIILAFSGGVKLVDFGIAKAATKIAHTRAGVLKGKYAYMSPEQIRGDEIDARSDLFAAGIVLYELLCGKRPFEKENSIQTLKAIVQEPHVDCRLLNSAIPDTLAGIIDKALTKSPNDRWSSAQELQLALEDFVTGTGKRCNNIAISKWVTELFAEELSRDRGGTMIFKGVGEVILPDLEEKQDSEKAKEAEANNASVPSEAANDASDAEPARDDSSAVPLERGRGGGSVGIRPGIPAPSTMLPVPEASSEIDLSELSGISGLGRKDSEHIATRDPSGRADLIEEGVIDRRAQPRADSDGGFSDDKTALADEVIAKHAERENTSETSEPKSREDFDEPEMQVPRRQTSFEDSKTEFGPGSTSDQMMRPGIHNEATWIPPPGESFNPSEERSSTGSIGSGDIEDVSSEAEPIEDDDSIADRMELDSGDGEASDDLWDEATVGFPGGAMPAPAALSTEDTGEDPALDEEPSDDKPQDAFAQAQTGEMEMLPPPLDRNESPAPANVIARARQAAASSRSTSSARSRPASGVWEGFSQDSTKNGEDDPWDDKTATNDAYQADDSVPSPVVDEVERSGNIDLGDATISGAALSDDMLGGMGDDSADLSGEHTMSSLALARDPSEMEEEQGDSDAELSNEMLADPTISAAALEDALPDYGSAEDQTSDGFDEEAHSVDATIAGGPAIDDGDAGESDVPDFGTGPDFSTTRGLDDEPELPVPRSNKNVDADSRTVAGVASDFINAGIDVPDGGAYDPEAGIELDLRDRDRDRDSSTESGDPDRGRPKLKRGGRGLGQIKLSKVPVEKAASKPDSGRFDPSEEMTEAGSPLERAGSLPKLARVNDFESEMNAAFDDAISAITKGNEEPTGEVSVARIVKPEVKHEPIKQDIKPVKSKSEPGLKLSLSKPEKKKKEEPAFDPFDELVMEGDEKPLSNRAPIPMIAAKIPPPLNPPSAPAGGPMGIGSTNVPPASLSLSEMLAIPSSQGSGRNSFQVLGRGGSNGGAPRGQSIARREIREVVRGPAAPDPAASRPGVLELPSPAPLQNFSNMVQQPAPLSDLGGLATPSMFQDAEPPRRSSQRIILIAGIFIAFLALVGTGFLLVPQLFPRDPQLTIRTTPDGAEIYLNGQLQPAKTPATLGGLQPGVTYELKLVREGYEQVQKSVLIPKNTRNILVQIPLTATQ